MAVIPAYAVEYFLLGRTGQDVTERFTQDGGIVTDVWVAFARDSGLPQRVLLAPSAGTSAVDLGFALHRVLTRYRTRPSEPPPSPRPQPRPTTKSAPPPPPARPAPLLRGKPSVSQLEHYVVANVYLDELVRVVLPLTTWWHRKKLVTIANSSSVRFLTGVLERAIRYKLGRSEEGFSWRSQFSSDEVFPDRRVMEAASLAALIGVFHVAEVDLDVRKALSIIDDQRTGREDRFVQWVEQYAEDIAAFAIEELSLPVEEGLLHLQKQDAHPLEVNDAIPADEPPELVQRVFLDRQATLADLDANCTVKADAATRLFDVSCRAITWAILDSGIASTHPAFLDHGAVDRRGLPVVPTPNRIHGTYNFTPIERIRSFDLTVDVDGSVAREAEIADVVNTLVGLPGRIPDATFPARASGLLRTIARQLEQRIPPDWSLIEPLIRLSDHDDGAGLPSDHGTHVAGILGADWRRGAAGTDVVLQGVCPDIGIYDLRVIHPNSRRCTEFALLAATEFVQFVNMRAAGNGPLIHGVNISLSIPHDVRNYGCGATPICIACDRLVGSGVVVVAAAGNRGWNEQEIGFGNFVLSSITDPGNAQEVITVGSTHRLKPHTFGVSYFSSRGPTGDGRAKPDIVAPGEQIRGPIRGDTDDELDGTSMAAPFVSGAAAMLMARHRELIGNPRRVKQILCDSATDLGREKYFQGRGLVDILRALQSV